MSDTSKLNLYEAYKIVSGGKESELELIPSAMMFPLIRWFSFEKSNVNVCNTLNIQFKYVNYKLLRWLLYFKINIERKYIKYLKASKEDDKLLFLEEAIKKYFNYSEREYQFSKKILDKQLLSQDFKKMLSVAFGFDQKQCRALGVEYKVEKASKKTDTSSKSLFSFVKKC